MTDEQINRKCAELDGFKPVTKMIKEWDVIDYNGNGEWVEKPREMFERDGASVFPEFLPNYTTSYDAILPLIQKQTREIQFQCGVNLNWNWLSTPRQLCEALLRAVGKWEELSPR